MNFTKMSSELLGVDPQTIKQREEHSKTMQSSLAESFNEFYERQRTLIDRLLASEISDKRKDFDKDKEAREGSMEVVTKRTSVEDKGHDGKSGSQKPSSGGYRGSSSSGQKSRSSKGSDGPDY